MMKKILAFGAVVLISVVIAYFMITDTKKTTYCSSWADYNSDGWDDMLIVDNSGGKS
jgi:hypothetical protein